MEAIQTEIDLLKKTTSNICRQISDEEKVDKLLDFVLDITKDFNELNTNLSILNDKIYDNINDPEIKAYVKDFELIFNKSAKLIANISKNKNTYSAIKKVFSDFRNHIRVFKENLEDIKMIHFEIPQNKDFNKLIDKVSLTLG